MLSDEIIELEYHPEDENGIRNPKIKKNVRLGKVSYHDEQSDYINSLMMILWDFIVLCSVRSCCKRDSIIIVLHQAIKHAQNLSGENSINEGDKRSKISELGRLSLKCKI